MPARIHPLSLALGVVFTTIAFLSMSQATVINSPVRVQYMPHPKDMVQIKEGTPYTVPTGKIFVLTALGSVGINTDNARLFVNGQEEVSATFSATSATLRTHATPIGFTAVAGSTVAVAGSFTQGRAWGYLANQ